MEFLYFFTALYFFSSLLAYTIKSYEIFWVEGVAWSNWKSVLGDFVVRFFFIFIVFWSINQMVDL